MSEQVYRPARGSRHHKPVGFGVSQAARTARFQLNDGVLRWKLRWRLVLMVFFHCLWVWKGRTDVSEPVYRPARGPRHHYRVGFGVSQAARLTRFQMDNGVLRWKLGWRLVLMVFFHCLWVWKGRTDVSEQVYILGRGPRHHKPVRFGVSQAASTDRLSRQVTQLRPRLYCN